MTAVSGYVIDFTERATALNPRTPNGKKVFFSPKILRVQDGSP